MKRPFRAALIAFIIIAPPLFAVSLDASEVAGQERLRWNNERVNSELHPSFSAVSNTEGTVSVELTDASVYRQFALHERMDKITWDDAYWYACDGAVLWAESDDEALTRCL